MDRQPSPGPNPEPARRRPASPPLGPPPPPPTAPPPPDPTLHGSRPPPTDSLAVLGLILGIFALIGALFCVVPGPIFGIPAAVVGFSSQRRIAASPALLGGSGLALAAWICGVAGILISAVYVALFLAGILALGNLGYLQLG